MKKWFHITLFLSLLFLGELDATGVKVIAHRGGSMLAPENTLAAFKNAIALKADYIELDVQLSSDDSLMIMHDASIDRTTTGTGTVRSKTYAQLKTVDAGVKFSSAFTGEKIPTLPEVFAEIVKSGNMTIGLCPEFKSTESNVVQLVVAEVQKWNMQSRVVLSSFNYNQLASVKSLDPSIRVQLYGSANTSMMDGFKTINGDWIGSDVTNQTVVDYAHTKGLIFNSWTINSAPTMIQLMGYGVDGIISDDPKTLIAVSDTSAPTDVVVTTPTANETKVTLSWQPAEDTQSGISNYLIYRDVNPSPTTLLTTVGKITEYVDETYTENQTYYYRIKARNTAGMLSENFSNEVSITTNPDVTKPTVAFVSSMGDTSNVVVEFSERVDQTTAETAGNYSINKSVAVLSAKLLLDSRQVFLTTTKMNDTTYTITVKNVKDLALTPNAMAQSATIFRHTGFTSDVVASYSLDNEQISGADTLILDATANANNGAVKNGPVIGPGYLGNAMIFDGVDDYVQFASSPSFDISSGVVSVSLWTKLTYLPADLPSAYGPLFDSETDNYVLYEDRGNNQLRFKVTTTSGAARPGINAADLKTGEWLHVVGVYDGTNAKIYMNGILKGSLAVSGTVKTGQVAMLGKSGTSTPSYFKGAIDNVQVFNKALTYQEIVDLYTGTKSVGVSPNPSTVKLNAPVVTETSVKLNWNPSVTYESTMMGYEIYRDEAQNASTLIATVGPNVTEYTDMTDKENQTFYYRVRAKNSVALVSSDYSNEVQATTATDTKPPVAVFITANEQTTKVIVEFSESVDKTSAETVANYTLDNSGQMVQKAVLGLDGKSVFLTTLSLTAGTHTLGIENVKDKAAISNTIPKGSKYEFTSSSLSSDLVAYYSMDDARADTLFDATANANNGLFMNGTNNVAGFSGNALNFNGVDNFVQFSTSPSFDMPGGVVTVSVWAKLKYLPTEMPGGFGPLFDSQDDQYVLYADKGNKELRFKATSSNGAARPGIPQADLITGQWINAVGVFDGTNATVYFNGVKKGTLPLTGTIKPGQVAMLGKSGTSGTPGFLNGQIDNVAIYSKALSETEIQDLYTNFKVPAKNIGVGVQNESQLPVTYDLAQNFPNPFNPSTRLNYQLPASGKVTLKIFDVLGREVATLVDEMKEAGRYSVNFNASALASGAYFYRLQAGSFVSIKKMMLLK